MTSTHSSHPAPLPYTRLPDLTGSTVENGKLKLVELLGHGSFAKVYKALDTQSTASSGAPIHYAVKCLLHGEPGSQEHHNLQNELKNHTQVSGLPGVVALHRAFVEGEHVFVVMELCDTDLNRFVIEHKDCDEQCDVAKRVFLDVLDAVETCHAEGVFHRDLKPGNILCDANGKNIRIADFGVATRSEESKQFGVGTAVFASPENMDKTRDTYSPRGTDCWSLGVILIALMTSSLLWKAPVESDDTYCAYRADPTHFFRGTLDLSPSFSSLANRIFDPNPARRPSIPELRTEVEAMETFVVPPPVDIVALALQNPLHKPKKIKRRATPPPVDSNATTPLRSLCIASLTKKLRRLVRRRSSL
ncbi:unnamed protein product [Mycena citricolor]|uniref:non-specific serine/threonine protein kinase n=1 Tax=Mycena citricolor TaxID=2018698 RepID=A0AAD2Q319_9AGAR|nr:unnamed protein product [Mycena citricolor]